MSSILHLRTGTHSTVSYTAFTYGKRDDVITLMGLINTCLLHNGLDRLMPRSVVKRQLEAEYGHTLPVAPEPSPLGVSVRIQLRFTEDEFKCAQAAIERDPRLEEDSED